MQIMCGGMESGMLYRENKRSGEKLSILGFGCMRFPRKAGGIDFEETERQIVKAVEAGINYFDTAYVYPGSEETLGKILKKNGLRDQVKIATKLPHYLIKGEADLDRYFSQQCARLRTDTIDYYLMHMLPDVKVWKRLLDLGIERWIEKKKACGAIKNIGFSYHGGTDSFIRLVDAYDWDFCQIQYNYLDENSQAGRRGLLHAAGKGLPVIIMEPLRGGRLANGLPAKAAEVFAGAEGINGKELCRESGAGKRTDTDAAAVEGKREDGCKGTGKKRSPAEWAFRWLWDQPEVTVVLSGMNSVQMLMENVRAADTAEAGKFTDREKGLFVKAVAAINDKIKVGCTGCGYCMPCPAGVDIPGVFRCYNARYLDGFVSGMREYIMCTTMKRERSNASLCKKCGKCERHCPQGIEIRRELDRVKRAMENPIYKAAAWGISKFVKL